MLLKKELFDIPFTITDYERASDIIIEKAMARSSFGVSALAVHGLMETYQSAIIKEKVRQLDMVVPDGQPVKWALNSLHNTQLKDRVYGPELTLAVLKKANDRRLKVFLFGSTKNTLQKFSTFIQTTFPSVIIAGIHVDRFRDATAEEDQQDVQKINDSEAHIVLVGRGCPRQEIWVADHLQKIHAPMMAVGAAFDFHAGVLKQAPRWMQKNGLEWLFRFIQEPQRLWKRYLITNSLFIYLFLKTKFRSIL